MLKIQIKTSERAILVGKTGTGKTTLAKYLTKAVARLVVVDSKGTLRDWNLAPFDDKALDKLRDGKSRVRVRVLKPPEAQEENFYDLIFRECYEAGNVVVYIDEMFAVVTPGARPPDYLAAIYTRGRDYGIGIWASTQRPSLIPLIAISEAEHFFCFRLNLDDDRRRMAGFMGPVVLKPILDKHGFYYVQSDADQVHYVPSLFRGEPAPGPAPQPAASPEKEYA